MRPEAARGISECPAQQAERALAPEAEAKSDAQREPEAEAPETRREPEAAETDARQEPVAEAPETRQEPGAVAAETGKSPAERSSADTQYKSRNRIAQ
jgi:hypothetical protein